MLLADLVTSISGLSHLLAMRTWTAPACLDARRGLMTSAGLGSIDSEIH